VSLEIILRSGLSTGTILLFAAIGEILTELSGVQNLGVEGMMLLGAMAAFKTSLLTGSPWLGLLAGIAAGGLLSLAHAVVTIHFQADQVVSGLSLTFLGTGLALVLGEGLSGQNAPLIPNASIPLLSNIPLLGRVFFSDLNVLVFLGYLLIPFPGGISTKPVPACYLRAVGEKPAAADSLGINVYGVRYLYTFVGGLSGWPGRSINQHRDFPGVV
jgi:Uncharacterized ABC-type transport system, permease component